MKKMVKNKIIALLIITACAVQLSAQKLVIASGAGYKKPVTEIINAFKGETGMQVDAIFGNLQMVATQAKESGEVACVIGDKKFLEKLKSSINFTDYTPLGKGILVLAYRKGISINKLEDIITDKVKSLFMPQDGKAIYGIAGKETLENLRYMDKVSGKLTQVATVPQVGTYLLTGEADAGFINLTEALADKERLGGYIIVPQKYYKPIEIVAGTVSGFGINEQTIKFLDYLKSEKTKSIVKANGL
ncbi:MAG: molybdate ABC transporter substrate-binding protein [Paludibacter sp.]|nr:molybdate ABC transporter substrate-binding protein [Paludibacter sp.]